MSPRPGEPADSPAPRAAGTRVVVTFGRAVWLQVVRAPALERLAAQQHHETCTTPAGRGTIFDRMGVQLAIGEQATTVYADPRQVRNAQKVAVEAGRALNIDPNKIYPQLLEQEAELRLRRSGRPTRSARPRFSGAASPASTSIPRSGASTRSTPSRRRCSATRASTTTASPGWSSGSTATSRASPARRRSCATRSGGRSTSSARRRSSRGGTSS